MFTHKVLLLTLLPVKG